MNNLIYRVVGKSVHVLNTTTGKLLTFEMSEKELLPILQNWTDPELELTEEIMSLFVLERQTNTRLCRSSLNSLGMELGFPTIVNLEINRRCSMRCVHCYIGAEFLESSTRSVFEDMSVKQQSLFLDELRGLGVFLLVFTGGEPFLNVKLEQLFKLAREKGFVVEIFSNLQQIPSWFWKLDSSTAMIGRVQVSIYSSDPVVHDDITTIMGSHERSMRNLKRLQQIGFYVEVATPLMKSNFDTWETTRQLFTDLGVKQNFSWPIVEEYYSEKTGKTSLNITAQQLKQFIDRNPDFLMRTEFTPPNDPVCEAGRSMFSISSDGNVFPCSQFPYPVGNITKDNMSSIYRSKAMQRIRDYRMMDTGLKEAYNYCMGENFVQTGNPLKQSKFFIASIRSLTKQKGGKP